MSWNNSGPHEGPYSACCCFKSCACLPHLSPSFLPQALRAVGLCGGHDLIDHQVCQEEGESLGHPVVSAKKKKKQQLCHNSEVKRGQESRQVFEAEPVDGVWSGWGEWSECSQTCGVGVSHRTRKCLPPPPRPQTAPLSFAPPNWAGYYPGSVRGPAISPGNPYYPSHYPGQHPSYHSPSFFPLLNLFCRASSVRPGQFGYGKVPFSLPLHRTNRRTSHSEHRRNRVPPQHSSRSLPVLVNRQRFDWNSVTAPPPPQSHPRSPGSSSLFTSPLHRPNLAHTEREPHPGFGPQAPPAGSIFPLQHPHTSSHLGAEANRHGGGDAPRLLRCSGPEKEYRRCFSQVCGGGALDSRAEQCTAFNNQEFMGRLYNWEPFTEGEHRCELTCRPVGYRFYVRLAERVRDGTPCFNTSANDVCVEGQCLTEGCDGILGSSAVIDKCGVCGGRDRSCRKVTGSLPNGTVPLGYHKIVDIPPGATFITITERRASPNYLAIRSGTGASVVNGGWAVDAPGDYQAGGTTFTYTQPRAQAEGEEEKGESLRARGPTTTQLQLYVSTEAQEGIYFNPANKHRAGHCCDRSSRRLKASEIKFCSQHREVICVNRHTEEEVAEGNCDSAAKPTAQEESCNTQPCPPFWEASAWSECSVSCGPGVQQRQLQCRQSFGSRSTMVHPQRCAHLTQPDSTQVCQLRLCSHWEVSTNWSTCSVDCGMGRRTRSVRCLSDQGSVVNDNECNSRLRPDGSEECNMGPCVTNWYFTEWSNTCSAQCGPGVQKREVVCLTRGGVRDGGGGVDCVAEKPAELKACNKGPCVPVKMWYSSPWTECNVHCGDGSQRREIICVQKLGNDFTVVPSTECAHLEKPAAVQECSMAECRPQWFTTEWSACSRSCGKGLQVREVRCLTPDKEHSLACDPSTKPEQEQICNTIPCGPQVADKNCRDRRDNCLMVVQARMCVYSYYKMACCASCTQSALRAKRH
uniref:PLAC domain-containing protein n=1 Tax=Xiphophorus couchianus TaxID=32473 RepID=A0A3B5MRI5_9TELE